MISLRPSDANETVAAWKFAIEYKTGPIALLLTRQKLPTIDRTKYPSADNLVRLESGIVIEGKKTHPAKTHVLDNFLIDPRNPPIRFRKDIPDSWISFTITEGRNRQVRKMTAAIGHPTLRLIRVRIKNLYLGNLKPGEVRKLTKTEIELLTS